MFGLMGDRLRRWLSGGAGPAAGEAAVAATEQPGRVEPEGFTNGTNNGLSDNGSGADVEASRDNGSPTQEPAQLNEYSKE